MPLCQGAYLQAPFFYFGRAGDPCIKTEKQNPGLKKGNIMLNMNIRKNAVVLAAVLALGTLTACSAGSGPDSSSSGGTIELTNVSYDPTRELYAAYNEIFEQHYVQVVADAGLIDDGFVSEFPLDSSPYTSTIVFLVRSGNPKGIYDWDDLIRDDVGVITPNPKTSGGAMWNYLAAWYFFEQQGQSDEEILDSIRKLYGNVVVLDSGARGSTTSFVENGQGDVLLAWENEAFLSLKEHPGEYEIVVPSVSILCQPTVAVVDEVTRKHDTVDAATEYLNYLYSDEAQVIEAENFYRPSTPEIYAQYVTEIEGSTITEIPENGKWINDSVVLTDINHFGGWEKARAVHFADGANFDSIYEQ